MKRNPQEIMMLLADALKKSKEGDSLSIKQIRERTGLHYETIQSYAEIIKYIQTSMPKINYDKENGIKILVEPDLQISRQDELILFLFDNKAFREAMSIEKPNWASEDIIQEASEKGLLATKEDRYYLSSQGILEGVDLADKREDALIEPIGKFVQEPEEKLVEKAFLTLPKFDSLRLNIFGRNTLISGSGVANLATTSNSGEYKLPDDRGTYFITDGLVEAS
jgi:hypothetical protein